MWRIYAVIMLATGLDFSYHIISLHGNLQIKSIDNKCELVTHSNVELGTGYLFECQTRN